MIAFAFGLVHGFGFSFALRQTLQFAGAHMLTSLLSFNVGVEIGQLLVLVVVAAGARAALPLRRRREARQSSCFRRSWRHTAWHWMQDRASALSGFSWPAFDAATAVWAVRGLMLALILFAGWRIVAGRLRRSGLAAIESDTPLTTKE